MQLDVQLVSTQTHTQTHVQKHTNTHKHTYKHIQTQVNATHWPTLTQTGTPAQIT